MKSEETLYLSGDVTREVVNQLSDKLRRISPEKIPSLEIHSKGGNLFEAMRLHRTLRKRAVRIVVRKEAGSCALVIVAAGAERETDLDSVFSFHNTSTDNKGAQAGLTEEQVLKRLIRANRTVARIISRRTGVLSQKEILWCMEHNIQLGARKAIMCRIATKFID
jgi:ATP-dependent protease ClpP protease subunit